MLNSGALLNSPYPYHNSGLQLTGPITVLSPPAPSKPVPRLIRPLLFAAPPAETQQAKSLGEKEQEFLDALRSFYFEGKPNMSNEDFDNLKQELLWEGSKASALLAVCSQPPAA